MQIYEITNGRRMQEVFAPGGAGSQAGSFLGGVGQNLAKAMIPAGGNTDAAPGASVVPGQASGAAAAASAPAQNSAGTVVGHSDTNDATGQKSHNWSSWSSKHQGHSAN